MEPSHKQLSLSSQKSLSQPNNPPNFSELASLSSSSILANQEDFSNSSSTILQQVQQMQQNLKQFSQSSAEKEGQEFLEAQCQIIYGVNQWRQVMFDTLKINISELSPALSEDIMAIKSKLQEGEGFLGQVQFVLNQMQAMDFLRLNYKDNATRVTQFLKKTQATLNYDLACDLINNNSILQIYFTHEIKKYNSQQQTIQNGQSRNNNNKSEKSTNQSKNEISKQKQPESGIIFKNNDDNANEEEGSNFTFQETAMDQSKNNDCLLDEQFFDFVMDDTDFLHPARCCFQEEYNIQIKEGVSQCYNLLSLS